jgi:predicted metal-binding protein
MPHRERYLFVCTNRREDSNPKGSCAQKGSEELVKALKDAVFKRGGAKTVRVCASGCLDLCDEGISAVQEPAHVAYGHLTKDDVEDLAAALVEGGVLERRVVSR